MHHAWHDAGIIRIRPFRKGARVYHMGTVMLRDVDIFDAQAHGELVHESFEVMPPDHPALRKRLRKAPIASVKPGRYKIAYFAGSDFYYC